MKSLLQLLWELLNENHSLKSTDKRGSPQSASQTLEKRWKRQERESEERKRGGKKKRRVKLKENRARGWIHMNECRAEWKLRNSWETNCREGREERGGVKDWSNNECCCGCSQTVWVGLGGLFHSGFGTFSCIFPFSLHYSHSLTASFN